jgi:hypothetical protein
VSVNTTAAGEVGSTLMAVLTSMRRPQSRWDFLNPDVAVGWERWPMSGLEGGVRLAVKTSACCVRFKRAGRLTA